MRLVFRCLLALTCLVVSRPVSAESTPGPVTSSASALLVTPRPQLLGTTFKLNSSAALELKRTAATAAAGTTPAPQQGQRGLGARRPTSFKTANPQSPFVGSGYFFTKINTTYSIDVQNDNNQKEILELLHYIVGSYMTECVSIILYDEYYEKKLSFMRYILKYYPENYINGKIAEDSEAEDKLLIPQEGKCSNYVVLITDVTKTGFLLGNQSLSKVVVLTDASVWKIKEFLSVSKSQGLVNLIVIANSYQDGYLSDINIYTHNLWMDNEGRSEPKIVTSWRRGKLARRVQLFEKKMLRGFNGFKFTVAVRNQPPFVFRRAMKDEEGNTVVSWDGLEVRLLKMLATQLNFTLHFQEPSFSDKVGVEMTGVVQELLDGRADIGASGIYTTTDRINTLGMSKAHSLDCATFITLTSTALPRYRAIMGPFRWQVWMGLVLVYFFAIFPLAFSYSHTLRPLLRNPWEMENMFWYVFGTFTNCFSFSGKKSWCTSDKVTTRLIVGWYWAFTIVITACYTGSVIAFITIPVFPEVIDSSKEVYDAGYTVGTLDGGGWRQWFLDSADPITNKLFERMEYVPDVTSGLRNVSTNYFWPYAFLGSRAWLGYVVKTNFSSANLYKRALLHLASECFVPFQVALAFPPKATYGDRLDQAILRAIQSGLVTKQMRDVDWEMQRSATGQLLQASSGPSLRLSAPEDRKLTLDDVQGTFLLLGAGFGIGITALCLEVTCVKGREKLAERRKTSFGESSTTISSDDLELDRQSDGIDNDTFLRTMSMSVLEVKGTEYSNTLVQRPIRTS